ncbi:MAG: hypothetical protein HFI63_08655 [Lachnospiraceae bacterium]|nr:hypothetical protein [Lachnospiraceae bacterium]
MAEKELRKLNRRELLQMLLVQCEESERLQLELDEINERFDVMSESYERLKKKLDVKDERLNQKDAKIGALGTEIEELKAENEALRRTGMVGSASEAAERISEIFKEAQRRAEECLRDVQKSERGEKPVPFKGGRISSIRKKQNTPRLHQEIPADSELVRVAEQAETEFASLDIAAGGIYG